MVGYFVGPASVLPDMSGRSDVIGKDCDLIKILGHVDLFVISPCLFGLACLASPANLIYGRVLAKVLSHVTIMPVLLRPVNNFLGQVIGNASEGKYNTVVSPPQMPVPLKYM